MNNVQSRAREKELKCEHKVVDREEYGSTKESRLARREAQTRLGIETSWTNTKRDRGGPGSDGGSGQPVDAQAQEREEKKRSKPTRQKEPGPV
jgi:hypothetical protein